jgi:serine/threonine protein kinase
MSVTFGGRVGVSRDAGVAYCDPSGGTAWLKDARISGAGGALRLTDASGEVREQGRLLAEGAFGKVYLFARAGAEADVVVKVMPRVVKRKPNAEAVKEERLAAVFASLGCDTIPARVPVASTKNFAFVAMPRATGSLRSLAGKLGKTEAIGITQEAAKICACLVAHGYLYTDAKADNFLYFPAPRRAVNVFLADLGGACPAGTLAEDATYTVWDDKAKPAELASEADVAFALAVMLVQLAAPPVTRAGANWWDQMEATPQAERKWSAVWASVKADVPAWAA